MTTPSNSDSSSASNSESSSGNAAENEAAVLTERQGHLLIVTLNRPERKNAINGEMLVRMLDAFIEADTNPDIRAIVLTGAGGDFCSGADLKEKKK